MTADAAADAALGAALDRLAGVGRLLVACDFDGVLAPIVDDPDRSAPLPAAAAALEALAGCPRTTVALVSGRALADLVRRSGLAAPIRFVGSHGAEWADGPVPGHDSSRAARLADLTATLDAIAAQHDGAWVERKPVGAVLHVRRAAAPVADAAVAAAEAALAGREGVHVLSGKAVVDASVVLADKGTALTALRAAVEADAVLFAGDDVTDEYAMTRLGSADVGVRVGPGDTAAAYRVPDPAAFADVLTRLVAARRAVG